MAAMKHILAIPVPLHGHIFPLIHFCAELACRAGAAAVAAGSAAAGSAAAGSAAAGSAAGAAGCKLSIIVPDECVKLTRVFIQDLENAGKLKPGVSSIHSHPWVVPPMFTGGLEQITRLSYELSEVMSAYTREVALGIAAAARDVEMCPVSCIVADHQIGFWVQDIANELKVPRMALWISALAEFALILRMPQLISSGTYDPYRDDSENCKPVEVPGFTPLSSSDVPHISQYPAARGVYWDYCLKQMARVREAKHVFINSFYDLEKEAVDYIVNALGLPLKLVGPLLPMVPPSVDKEGCISWLDGKPSRSVLYVSFGTLVKLRSRQMEEIVLGLEASKQSILMVFKLERSVDGEPEESLLQALQRMMHNRTDVKVVEWAPQMKVLDHPATGGFFLHYGSNSLLEGLRSGVPMIGKPLLGDSLMLRRLAVHQWKIALDLEGNGEHWQGVAASAARLIQEGDEVRNNVIRLQKQLHKTLQEGGDSYECLNRVALDI